MLTTTVFDKIEHLAIKTGKCGCGKRRRRQKTFWQTRNPFNKNKKGFVKTRNEIVEELRKEAEVWKKEPLTCDNCS